MPWSPSAIAGAGELSLLHYTICYRHPKAELYNDGTLVKSLSASMCGANGIIDGGYVTIEFFDSSTDTYTFNGILLKRDPYIAQDGSSKDVILTVDIPEGRTKAADETLSFSIRLTIVTTSG